MFFFTIKEVDNQKKILFENKLIHQNKEGAIINKNGIIEIEKNKEKYFN